MLRFLKQGTSPHKLAVSVSLGFILGLFPILGVTTPIGFLLAFVFRLNAAALQLVNYLVYPIQLALIIPFIKFGIWMFDVKGIDYSLGELLTYMQSDFLGALKELWFVYFLGVFAWMIFVIPMGVIVFLISRNVFQRAKSRLKPDNNVTLTI